MLHMGLSDIWVCNYAFCIIIFPRILSFVSCIDFITFWNQYTDSIVNPLYMRLFGAVSDNLSSQISLNYLSHFVSTLHSQMW